MSELKPCPFCGKRPHLIEPDKGDFKWSVSCLHCVAIDMHDISKEGVIKKWNARHYPPEVEKAVERMKPKKPLVDSFLRKRCPNCSDIINKTEDRYQCWYCGQALDWEVKIGTCMNNETLSEILDAMAYAASNERAMLYHDFSREQLDEAKEKLDKLIERDTPKKLIRGRIGNNPVHVCPGCGYSWDSVLVHEMRVKPENCPRCGQRLDWSE